ncbi:hypothetical protein DFH08DRAFT_844228 [Mycena albidolilacea]|uniref:Metallo-dependent hydrolase n=1 Tax=Mycena albidolilacea TaxID=1033008 RepID=A0AAD7AKK2_9AGAR|nr:hypothetical protein DFH08DRAFT_844228 [Mycena albidolilacea]
MAAAFPPDVFQHVVDAHCHPTEANSISAESMKQLQISVCAMSTHHGDQRCLESAIFRLSGYHPWFTHLISLLPVTSKSEHYRHLFLGDDSQPSAEATSHLRHNFELFSSTLAMLGEVGLDKQYRVAFDYHASPRRLTPFTIPLDHQLAILEAQIDIAVELRRNVSLHSVKCPQITVDLINKLRRKHGEQLDNIRLTTKKHNNVFISLSTTINGRSNNLNALITACSPNRLLIESDIDNIDRCTEKCIEILNLMARVKGWPVEEAWVEDLDKDEWGVVRRIEANWKAFIGENLQK